jgi:hypothetical protein
MNSTLNNFIKSISDILDLGDIYNNNIIQYPLLTDLLGDILRFQLVYAISAFDKFMHEIVRIGFTKLVQGGKRLTKKAENFNLPLNKVLEIYQTAVLPLTFEDNLILYLDKEIYRQHSFLAFQYPDKIKDALSLIWEEDHKWQKIVENMTIQLTGDTINEKEKYLEQVIKLIVDRRNQIVHEADVDLILNRKRNVDKDNINESILIIKDLGNSIYKCLNNNYTPN